MKERAEENNVNDSFYSAKQSFSNESFQDNLTDDLEEAVNGSFHSARENSFEEDKTVFKYPDDREVSDIKKYSSNHKNNDTTPKKFTEMVPQKGVHYSIAEDVLASKKEETQCRMI